MVKLILSFFITLTLVSLVVVPAQAAYGWVSTDDPVPFYHQSEGKWYHTKDTKMFMVQLNDRTYKYVFDTGNTFCGGWVTDLPIRLP